MYPFQSLWLYPNKKPLTHKNTGGQRKPLKHPVTNNTRPNKPATNQEAPKRRKEKNKAQRIRTKCKRKARIAKQQDKHRQNATNHRQEILEVSLRRSEGTHKVEEESNLRKNAVGKKSNNGHSMLFIGRQALGNQTPKQRIIETTCCLGIPRVGGSL